MGSLSSKCNGFTGRLEADTILHTGSAAAPLVVAEILDRRVGEASLRETKGEEPFLNFERCLIEDDELRGKEHVDCGINIDDCHCREDQQTKNWSADAAAIVDGGPESGPSWHQSNACNDQ